MDIASSIDAGVTFLISARDKRGWWKDFETLAGWSDEWVTAYVGTVLSSVPDERAARAARQAWRLLRRHRWWSPGWSYNGWVPPDADSTAWALRLAEAAGGGDSRRAARARKFLSKHVRPDGGIATYAADGPIRHFTRLNKKISFDGWCGAHTCVTAAAAALPNFEARADALAFLRKNQDQDGGWTGYWWRDREYTTALAVEALAGIENSQSAVLRAAADWACHIHSDSTTQPESSVFAAACRLIILCFEKDRQRVFEPLESSVAWLLRNQKPDGSWSPSAALRIPPPDTVDPENYQNWTYGGKGGGSILIDRHGVYTTATVIKALQLATRK